MGTETDTRDGGTETERGDYEEHRGEMGRAVGGDAGVVGGPSDPAMVGLAASVVLSVGNLVYGALLGAIYAVLQGVGPSS